MPFTVQGLSPEEAARLMKLTATGRAVSDQALLPGTPVRIARCACLVGANHAGLVGVLLEVRTDRGRLVALVVHDPDHPEPCRAADVDRLDGGAHG